MSDLKKILVSLPDSLLNEVDRIVELEQKNRSQFIREAMRLYLREREKIELREKLKNGYLAMGKINLELAEEGIVDQNSIEKSYENVLAHKEKAHG